MSTTKIASREFNQDIGRARRAAENGPVIITDRGEPSYVLMRYTMYMDLMGEEPSLRSLLDHPGVEDIEFDPPRLADGIIRAADFS